MDIIDPAEAFRRILRAHLDTRYGRRKWNFIGEIKSADWFRKNWSGVPISVQDFTRGVLERFRAHVREGEIRLRGALAQAPPAEIDCVDCFLGELDPFKQSLKVFKSPRDTVPVRRYEQVFCTKADVLKLVKKPKPALKTKTPPEIIRNEINAVYDAADRGGPRPNIKDLPKPVQPRLEGRGYKTSGRQIMQIGSEEQFVRRRRKQGEKITKQISRS
jgi:hypothetical protein